MLGYTLAVVGAAVVGLYVGFMIFLDSQLDAIENAFESESCTDRPDFLSIAVMRFATSFDTRPPVPTLFQHMGQLGAKHSAASTSSGKRRVVFQALRLTQGNFAGPGAGLQSRCSPN